MNYPFGTHRRTRTKWIAAITAPVLAVGSLIGVMVAPAANAAGATIASGVVYSDANANGAKDTANIAGKIDKPLAGVPVQLVTDEPTPRVLTSTTTAANGSYTFGDGDLAGHTGPVKISVNVQSYAGQIYAPEAASAENQLIRESVTVARSAAFTPSATTPQTIDGLLSPVWALSTSLFTDPTGMDGFGVFTGTESFDANDAPGNDSSKGNNTVRSGDLINYNWIISSTSVDSAGPSAGNAVFEQTIELSKGAVANFALYPGACTGTGVPANSIKAMPSGKSLQPKETPPPGTASITLTCNLGKVSNDEKEKTRLLNSTVWVSGDSPRLGEIKTTGRSYGVDAQGAATIRPSGEVEQGPVIVTAAPRHDISKSNLTGATFANAVIDGVQVPGYNVDYQIAITTDKRVGVEAFTQPVSVTDTLFAQYNGAAGSQNGAQNSVVPNLKWRITSCVPTTEGGADTSRMVLGKSSPTTSTKAVSDSGNCAISTRPGGDSSSPQTLTFSNIDTSGQHYPTNFVNGNPIPANVFYVASYRVKIFVPLTEIDKTTGSTSDSIGALSVSNVLSNFDPVGVSGTPNYGPGGKEPGYCTSGVPNQTNGSTNGICDPIDGARSNNVAGPTNISMSPGGWGKSTLQLIYPWANQAGLKRGVGQQTNRSGDAQIQPGDHYGSNISMTNAGSLSWNKIGLCDIFDSTVVKLAPLKNNVSNNNPDQLGGIFTYAIETGTAATAGLDQTSPAAIAHQKALQDNFVVSYAHASTAGDDPLLGGPLASDGTNRGTWSAQSAAKCADLDWKTSPDLVTTNIGGASVSGVDAVNAIKIEQKPDSTYTLPSGGSINMWLAMQQRDTFNGGPHNGDTIPAGTLAVNFAGTTSSGINKDWSSVRNYTPQPQGSPNDGDRWIVARAALSVTKQTVNVDGIGKGVAGIGQRGAALAGDAVVWKVTPSLTAFGTSPTPINNVTVTDTLPVNVKFNAECTSGLTGATNPTSVVENANGTTTIVWNLGTRTPNQTIAPLLICTDLDPLTPGNYPATNTVNVKAETIRPLTTHTVSHTVTVQRDSTLGLRKAVEKTQDLINRSQNYTLTFKNFSQDVAIQTPTILETLPYNNDGTGAAINRSPASNFVGQSGLSGPITSFDYGGVTAVPGTTYYTTIPGAQIPQDLNKDTDPSIWQSGAAVAAWTAADWAKVTGFKFVSSKNVEPAPASGSDATSGLVVKFQTKQQDNKSGNVYANRFTAFSPSLRNNADQSFILLDSNQTTVRVTAFSLGDLIWIDSNRDGKYTEGTDAPVPAGVKVQVFKTGVTTPVAEVVTDAGGRWHADNLDVGDYYAVIPASEFAEGGLLAGRKALTVNVADSAVAANEDVDHNAVQDGEAVRTKGVVHFEASNATGMLVGNGPLNDNVAKLALPSGTTDDFSNLTADMALAPMPGYEFTKTADPVSGTAVKPGQTIKYTLVGTNTGEELLDPVNITDDLSKVLNHSELVEDSLKAVISGDNAPASTPAATLTGTDLKWTGSLAQGQTVTITYTVKVNANAGELAATLKNVAKSDATPPGEDPITPPEVSTEHPVPEYAFTKVADPTTGSTVLPGGVINYTLTGKNLGATALDPVVITDDLSKVLNNSTLNAGSLKAVISGDGAPASAPAPTLTGTDLKWTGKLAVGQSVTVSYSVTVNRNAGELAVKLENKADSTATPPGLPPIDVPEVVTEHPVPGYTFAKTADPADGKTVLPEGDITYTLTGKNTGATVLDPVNITDDLSKVLNHSALVDGSLKAVISGANVPASTPAATLTGTDLAWTGSLAPGQTVTITYTVKVNKDAGTLGVKLENKADSTATPPGLPPIEVPEVVTEHPVPGYTFTKVADPVTTTIVQPGNEITYTLTGNNKGATALDPVNIYDDLTSVLDRSDLVAGSLKATITGAGAPASTPAPTLTGNDLKWTGSLAPGQSVTVSYTVKIDADANLHNVTLKNLAKSDATPPGGEPITPPEVSTQHPVPGYTFAKAADPATETAVLAGGNVTYTLTGKNTGATVLDPVNVNDDLTKVLDHSKLVDGSLKVVISGKDAPATAPAATVADNKLKWVGVLAPGQTVTITYTVQVNADANLLNVTLTNSAKSDATPPGEEPITPPEVSTEHPVPGYTFTKVADPETKTPVMPGNTVAYTLTGTNTGATVLDPVNINDDLTSVLDHSKLVEGSLKVVISGGSIPPATPQATLVDNKLAWTGTLTPGQSVTITYSVTVNADANLNNVTLKNSAKSDATPPGLPPITPPEVSTEHPVPGYTFTKDADPKSESIVQPGAVINYTLTGNNTGATVLEPVKIDDDLSGVLAHAKLVEGSLKATITEADKDPVTASAPVITGTTLNWQGTLAVGQSVKVTYSVTVNADADGVIIKNMATSTAKPPVLPELPTEPVETWHPTPGFTFMKTADPVSGSVVQAGGKINYTVTGNNFGETALETVVINDDLSGVLKYADIDGASLKAVVDGKEVAKPVLAGTKLSWNGSLEKGQNVVLTYSVTVKSKVASGVSVIKNVANATATPPGGEPIVPPEVTTEHPITDFALAKTSDPVSGSTVKSGEKINYSVVGTNLGAAAIPVVDISDDLSKVLPYATIDAKSIKASINGKAVDAPKLNGTKLSWMGSLAVGEVVTLSYTVTVKSTDVAVTLLNVATAAWQPPGGPVNPTPPVSTTHKVPPVPVTPPTTGPKLPDTGFSGAAIALVGASLVGLGMWLVVRRRRENRV